jgi:hypothetical protein
MSFARSFGIVAMVLAAVALYGRPAVAAPIYFADRTTFEAATDSTVVEDFLGFANGVTDNLGSGFVSNGITFTQLTGTVVTQALLVVENNPFFGPGNTSHVLTDNRNDDYRLDFSTTTRAVGFDTYLNNVNGSNQPATPEAIIEIFDVTDTLIDTFVLTHDHTQVGFFGVIADVDIGAVRWTTTGGEFLNTGITNITQGDAVPEPGAVLLFGVGLIGLGWARRRAA